MKKLIIFMMCLALICGSAFADQTVRVTVTGNDFVGESKFEDEPDFPDADSPRCIPCDDLVLCGTPTETENNGYCDTPDVTPLSCGSVIYGKICGHYDYFVITVPGFTELVVTIFDGSNCDRNPAVNARMKLYDANCVYMAGYVHDAFILRNEGFAEWEGRIKVRRDNCENTTYSLVVACEQIPEPCPDGIRNYCGYPIIVPHGDPVPEPDGSYYHYENVENSCCAENIIDCIHSGLGNDACGEGMCWASGPDIVYEMILEFETVLRIETGVAGGGDTQFMIVGDCNDPEGTCVLSRDQCDPGCNSPEIVEGLILPAGTYYIITSMFGTDICDDIYIIIHGDKPLPVELTSFDAVAGNGSVTLNWTTASESNSDRFDIVRNGTTVGIIAAENLATGASYTWTETNLTNGHEYTYELVSVDVSGAMNTIAEVSATPNFNAAAVSEYALHQNYPNPFNPETSISFDIAEAGAVSLTVFNPLGQTVATLVNGTMAAGRHTITFDGTNLTSGLYYYRLEAGDFSAIRKMVLMK